jgi:hypothetical protein
MEKSYHASVMAMKSLTILSLSLSLSLQHRSHPGLASDETATSHNLTPDCSQISNLCASRSWLTVTPQPAISEPMIRVWSLVEGRRRAKSPSSS